MRYHPINGVCTRTTGRRRRAATPRRRSRYSSPCVALGSSHVPPPRRSVLALFDISADHSFCFLARGLTRCHDAPPLTGSDATMREGWPSSRRAGPEAYLTVVQRLGAAPAGDLRRDVSHLTASRQGARHLGPMALTRHRRKHSQDKKNGSPADDGTGPQSTRKGKVGR